MSQRWQVGNVIKNYWQVLKIIGGYKKSGFGIVYVVHDLKHRLPLAAKTFQDEVFARDLEAVENFKHEAHVWINLDNHPNIANALWVDVIEDKPFIFVEYISGGDLSRWIGTPRLTEDLPQVLRFAIHFCDGMTHALSKGVTAHRDVKPANCLITQDRILKITDFGLARVVADQEGKGGGGGTPEYMSPEQWDYFERADERSDLYSFGVMLYEMVTGRLPFGRRSDGGFGELRRRHREAHRPAMASRSSVLEDIVQACLQPDPARRPSGFGELRERLEKVYESLTGASMPPMTGVELDAAQWKEKGYSYSELGLLQEALESFDKALDKDPGSALAWAGKGEVLATLNRFEGAWECYEQALKLEPDLERAWNGKAFMFCIAGRTEEALGCVEQVLSINEYNQHAWCIKGVTLATSGRQAEALACYDKALSIDPRFERAWEVKAAALSDLGRFDESLYCCDQSISIAPSNGGAWLSKGVTLGLADRLAEALECFEVARRLGEARAHDLIEVCRIKLVEAGVLPPGGDGSVERWFIKAGTAQDSGYLDEAIKYYDRVLELDPAHQLARNNKASALYKSDRFEESLACYEKLMDLYPKDERGWAGKGDALSGLGRYEEAYEAYDRALRMNPRLGEAQVCQGIVATHLARYEEALECFSAALGLNPDDANAWTGRGATLKEMGRLDESLASYDRALEADPGHSTAWYLKGTLLVEGFRRYDSATECLKRAQQLGDPRAENAIKWCQSKWAESELASPPNYEDDSQKWYYRGAALNVLGRWDEAIPYFDRVIALSPKDPNAWYGKGAALANSGRFETAMPCFENAGRLGHPQAALGASICRRQLIKK